MRLEELPCMRASAGGLEKVYLLLTKQRFYLQWQQTLML